jgi:hypothetical protein
MAQMKVVVELNPYNNKWDVNWWDEETGFTPYDCGYATKEEAEAQIPGFSERFERDMQEYSAKRDAEEQEENKEWPNIGHVRQQIKKLYERGKLAQGLDAQGKLDSMMNQDNWERISWPLPSWKIIDNGTWKYK